MPFERTPAVCLRRIDFSETSQVLHLFTEERGKLSCIAKGSKRRKGAFLSPFDILTVYDLIRIEKRSGTLDIVTQAERMREFPRLRMDYPRFVAACYGADLVDEFTREGLAVAGLFGLIIELLDRLDGGEVPVVDALFSFEARALKVLGYMPRARECGICHKPVATPDAFFSVRDGGAICTTCNPGPDRVFPVRRSTLESIARFGAGDMPRDVVQRPLVAELRQVFDTCVRYHLEREMRSARFLKGILLRPAS